MMRASPFRYHAPATAAEAARILREEGPGARILAGGTDLVPNMKRRQQVPTALVSLRRVAELRGVSTGDGLTLGAATSLKEVCRQPLPEGQRALRIAASQVATPAIRTAATLGGNLCLDTRCNYYVQSHAWRQAIDFCKKAPGPAAVAVTEPNDAVCWVAPSSPRCWAVSSSDTAPALIALGAQVTLRSADGERRIPLGELYADDGMAYLTKAADEVLTAIHLPDGDGWRSTYWKLRRRGSFDFPVLGVAAALQLDGDRVTAARVCLGAVASRPVEVDAAALLGEALTDEAIEAFAARAAKQARPMDNTDFGQAWRKRVTTRYVALALRELRGDPPESLGLLARTAARLPLAAR